MSDDDQQGDSLREIEAYLKGDESSAQPEEPEHGFDEMLKAALSTATHEAPEVEDNDAWLEAILTETEQESAAELDRMYGSPAELGQTAQDKPEPDRSGPRATSPGAPAADAGGGLGDESLEDAVAAALRSVTMPGKGHKPMEHRDRPPGRSPQRKRAVPPMTRRIQTPNAGQSRELPDESSREEQERPAAPTPESEKIKELREQVQQFGRETEQYRVRIEDQARQAREKGRQDVFDRLLPILDTLDIAIQSAPTAKSPAKVIAGVEMVYSQMLTELARLGLECINPVGELFDPAHHEAMQRSATGDVESGRIHTVLRRGFILNGKLLRAAQVIVEE